MTPGKWCLITAYDDAYRPIADLCVPSHRLYADRQGLDFFEAVDTVHERGPTWVKLPLVRQKFDEGYEFVLWVDADAYFRRFDVDVRGLVEPGGDLYFGDEAHVPAPPDRHGRLNSGVFILRNVPLVRRFLDEVEARPREPHWPFRDQSAIHAVLGFESMMAGDFSRPDPINAEYVDRLRWLPTAWNCGAGYDRVGGAVIRHFYSDPFDVKLRRARFVTAIDRRMTEAGAEPGLIEDVILDLFQSVEDLYERPIRAIEGENRWFRERHEETSATNARLEAEFVSLEKSASSRSWLLRRLWSAMRTKGTIS